MLTLSMNIKHTTASLSEQACKTQKGLQWSILPSPPDLVMSAQIDNNYSPKSQAAVLIVTISLPDGFSSGQK